MEACQEQSYLMDVTTTTTVTNVTTTTTTTGSNTGNSLGKRKRRKYQILPKQIRQRVTRQIDDAAISKKYRKRCNNAWEDILNFLRSEYPEIFDTDGKVIYTSITHHMFKDFAGGLLRKSLLNDELVLKSWSCVNSYKAGMLKHFSSVDFKPQPLFLDKLNSFMLSVRKTESKQRDAGHIKMFEGKGGIDMEFHKFLCLFLLSRGRKKDIWALCIILFAWNLIARINRVFAIRSD